MIYADNAASTRVSDAAMAAMTPFFTRYYGNPSATHSLGKKSSEALLEARETISSLLGCLPGEITFASGGSESDNQALISAAYLGAQQNKRHIVSSAFEHHAILHTLEKLKNMRFEITLLTPDSKGFIHPEDLESVLGSRSDTCLVTLMYANNEIGTVQPVAQLGQICHRYGVLFHSDAVQAAGHLPIDVNADNLDMLSLSAHKFHGPKGAGLLYARRGTHITSLIEGGAQERGKRAGTENMPAVVGMAVALKESCHNMSKASDKLRVLGSRLIYGLSQIPGSYLNGDAETRLPGNVNFSFDKTEGETLVVLLDQMGICVSSGSACAAGSLEPSHVLLSIGRSPELAGASLRISLSEENTMEEVEYIIKSVREAVLRIRNVSSR